MAICQENSILNYITLGKCKTTKSKPLVWKEKLLWALGKEGFTPRDFENSLPLLTGPKS